MALVYYRKVINGRLYPKAAREGQNVAYANEVNRVNGKVKAKYVGILPVPKGEVVETREKPLERLEEVQEK